MVEVSFTGVLLWEKKKKEDKLKVRACESPSSTAIVTTKTSKKHKVKSNPQLKVCRNMNVIIL